MDVFRNRASSASVVATMSNFTNRVTYDAAASTSRYQQRHSQSAQTTASSVRPPPVVQHTPNTYAATRAPQQTQRVTQPTQATTAPGAQHKPVTYSATKAPPQTQRVTQPTKASTATNLTEAAVRSLLQQHVPKTHSVTNAPAQTPQSQSYFSEYENASRHYTSQNSRTSQGYQATNRPQPQQQQQTRRENVSNAQQPSCSYGTSSPGHPQNRAQQVVQPTHLRNYQNTMQQNAHQNLQPKPQQVSQPKPQQVVQPKPQQVAQPKPQPPSQPKPQQAPQPKPQPVTPPNPNKKKQTLAEVVKAVKEVLEGYDGHKFTLEGIDTRYRDAKGESIPYGKYNFKNLSSFIESKCDFLTMQTGMDGNTQILLRPPSYQEAVNQPQLPNSASISLQEKHSLSNLVYDEISLAEFNRLKNISETRARNGITIEEFDNYHFLEYQTHIDFKGFSRPAFFRGLCDIIDMREERDGIKLYPKTQSQNTVNTPLPSAVNKPQQNNAGNKAQQNNAGNKAQQAGGQKQNHGNRNKSPQKPQQHHQQQQQQQRNYHNNQQKQQQHQQFQQNYQQQQQQHQPRHQQQAHQQQQQQQQRAQSRNRANSKKLESPFFEKKLKELIQQCKKPGGVTIAEFRKFFNEHSTPDDVGSLDYVDQDFYMKLPHIFQIIQTKNGVQLMPTPLTTGLARNNLGNWQSVSALDGTRSRTNCNKVSASVGSLAGKNSAANNSASSKTLNNTPSSKAANSSATSSSPCTMHVLIGGRCLWIVSIGNYEYVPTGCVAKLANMAKDTVINDLRKHSLEVSYIRKLDDQDIKNILVNNGVARVDEQVMTIPLKSVPLILRAFLGSNIDENFLKNLSEVSVEHVRNKRFGRPNRH